MNIHFGLVGKSRARLGLEANPPDLPYIQILNPPDTPPDVPPDTSADMSGKFPTPLITMKTLVTQS
jgi:hypothetical protein